MPRKKRASKTVDPVTVLVDYLLDNPLVLAAVVIVACFFGLPGWWKALPLLLVIGIGSGLLYADWQHTYLQAQRLKNAGIADIDQMSGTEFEKFMAGFFRARGYLVEETPVTGDFGADLKLTRNGVSTVVQLKCYKGKVDQKAVREALAAKTKYFCTEAMAITNSYFTSFAKELARVNEVELWDRDRLVTELLKGH